MWRNKNARLRSFDSKGNALKFFKEGNDIIRTAHFPDIAKSDNLEGGDCDDRQTSETALKIVKSRVPESLT